MKQFVAKLIVEKSQKEKIIFKQLNIVISISKEIYHTNKHVPQNMAFSHYSKRIYTFLSCPALASNFPSDEK